MWIIGQGLICLETGVLYYFKYISSGAIKYYRVASNVRLTNILDTDSTIYLVDYNRNLNILQADTLLDENVIKKPTIY